MSDDIFGEKRVDPAVERMVDRQKRAAERKRAAQRGRVLTGFVGGLAVGILLTVLLRLEVER